MKFGKKIIGTKKKEIWRIEFQIRRSILKEFELNTVEDLQLHENGLWVYLTSQWLLIKQPSGKNVSRWSLKRKWKIVQQARIINEETSPLVRESFKHGNVNRLLNQAAGIMMSVAALSYHNNIDETTKVLKTWTNLKLAHKQTSFQEETSRRRKMFF